jgi:hypothetical protein
MYADGDFDQWLDRLPLNEPVEIDGDWVYLNIHPRGAELGAYLVSAHTPAQLQDAMRLGFASALTYQAGLAVTPDGNALVLTQWLPAVDSWPQAVQPLENLLNQLSLWRATLAPSETPRFSDAGDRNERRLRTLLAGVKK